MNRHFVRSTASLAAVLAALALLVADSSGDYHCKTVAFDHQYTVSSTDCGNVTETVLVHVDPGKLSSPTSTSFQHVSGDHVVTSAMLTGSCSGSNQPETYDGLELHVQLTSFVEVEMICSLDLATASVSCAPARGSGAPTCAVQVVPAP